MQRDRPRFSPPLGKGGQGGSDATGPYPGEDKSPTISGCGHRSLRGDGAETPPTPPCQGGENSSLRVLAAGVFLLLLAWTPAFGADKDVSALAAGIDRHVAAAWNKDMQPAKQADDGEFFRRLHLDLVGRIPSIVEIRDFLDDPGPDKRRLWIERILQSAPDDPSYRDAYGAHFANVWRAWLLEQTSQQSMAQQAPLEAWLRQRLKANVGYDQLVRDLLTHEPRPYDPPGSSYAGSVSPYYSANEFLPENLAASTARLFLGLKLECAQCHAHPFAKWTREQFWEYAAFFADVPSFTQPTKAARPDPRDGIKITGTEKIAKARFLDGTAPQWKSAKTRPILVDWITAPGNPYFAQATVNRLWIYFFGIGLVDQFDGPPEGANSEHIALLEELSRAFVASKYDLKLLIRAIVASQTYQRTSAVSLAQQPDVRLFARMPLRGLSPEQLFDSLAIATECAETAPGDLNESLNLVPQTPRAQFLAKFPSQEQRTDYQMSILQALYLMNNEFIARQTSVRKNPTLATLVEQQTSTARKVESLYLVVLSRKPRPEESERFDAYVDAGDAKSALADVFWILLNSPEFILNH